MHMRIALAGLAALALAGAPARASIKLYAADDAKVKAQNPNLNVGYHWYREDGWKMMENGTIKTDTGWVDSMYELRSQGDVFVRDLDPSNTISGDYMVLGVADYLDAPETGTYNFQLVVDDQMFIAIDGKLLVGVPEAGTKAYPCMQHNTDTGCVTVAPKAAAGDLKHYDFTVDLTQGHHQFKFYYVQLGEISEVQFRWKKPSSQTLDLVPASAFGPRKNQGRPVVKSVTGGPLVGPSPLRVTLNASASTVAGQPLKYEWDFDGDGTVDTVTNDSSVTHLYVNASDTLAIISPKIYATAGSLRSLPNQALTILLQGNPTSGVLARPGAVRPADAGAWDGLGRKGAAGAAKARFRRPAGAGQGGR